MNIAQQPRYTLQIQPDRNTRLNDDLLGTTLQAVGIENVDSAARYFYRLANHDSMLDGCGQPMFTTATHSLNVALAVNACLMHLDQVVDLGELDQADKASILALREHRSAVSGGALRHDELKMGIAASVLQKPGSFSDEERNRVIMHAEGTPILSLTDLSYAELIETMILSPQQLPRVSHLSIKRAMQAAHHAYFGVTPSETPGFGRVTEFSVPGLPAEQYTWKSYPLHKVEGDRVFLSINGEYVPLSHTQLVASIILHVMDGGEAQWSLERPYKKEPVPTELITMRLRAANQDGLYSPSVSHRKLIEGCIKVLEREIHRGALFLTSRDVLNGRTRNASV